MPTEVKLPKRPADLIQEQVSQSDRFINNITFFGDSAIPEGDPIYNSVFEASKLLAQNGYTIVNGGGPGIMKAATDGAKAVNGKTIAVYWEPRLSSVFEGKNLSNIVDESEAYSNYMIRTLGLIEKGQAYVVCKGGTGTISEFGMVWALAKLYYGAHKPVILYGEFWDDLIIGVQKSMYIDEVELSVLYNARSPQEVLDLIRLHEAKLKSIHLKVVKGDEAAFVISAKTKATTKAYEQFAKSYHAQNVGKLVAQEQLDEFITMVNPPARILDVGSGPGHDSSYLSKKYSVTGIEPSKSFYEIACYDCPEAEFINADIVNYDIGVSQYKGIWARDSLHHIHEGDLDKVFKKLSNALVEGGILYAIVREGEGEILEKEIKPYTDQGGLERFYHLFTAEELTKRAESAGLKLVKLDHTQRSHKWLVGVFKKETAGGEEPKPTLTSV